MQKKTYLRNNEEGNPIFHIFAIACFFLGFFISFTAADMGAFSPLLISIGIYVAVFSIFLEGLYWGLIFFRRFSARWEKA